MLLNWFVNRNMCEAVWGAAAFPRMPCLSSQVTHHGDPFSASLNPTLHPLYLLKMPPLCLVLYPIILCHAPRTRVQLLSSSPVLQNQSCTSLPVVFLQLFLILFPACLSGLFHFCPIYSPQVFAFSSAHPDCLETDCSLCEGAEHA